MWKEELKKDLQLFKEINENLTSKICYLILWKEEFIKARIKDWFTEEQIQEAIEVMQSELDLTKEQLEVYYSNK